MQTKATFLLSAFLLLLGSSLHLVHGQIFENPSDVDDQDGAEEVPTRSMFPDDFIFGVSTSAYQIEGAYLEDGKGLNNWDVFLRLPENLNKEVADIADDHYHRYMEDIENLVNLRVDAYRFSISWARILPRGRFGEINLKGVKFYNQLINNLLLKGIKPFVTIHHFDMPQELEDRYGGWLSPLVQEDFVHFAKICFENFGDRVKNWVTINEPNINTLMSFIQGSFPPARCSPPFGNCSAGNSEIEPLIAMHNMVISHAKAVKLYRERFQATLLLLNYSLYWHMLTAMKPKQGGIIGLVLNSHNYVPYRDDEFSRQAVERSFAFNVAWVLDPLIYGEYPLLMQKYLGDNLPKFSDKERQLIKGSLDFIGLNHYTTFYAIDCFHYSECSATENLPIKGFVGRTTYRNGIPLGEQAGGPFVVVPQGMEGSVDYLTRRYPNTTIYITENGYTPPNNEEQSWARQDFKRIEFHQAYIMYLVKAMRKGANVKGYFAWSFMDNFEWTDGYSSTYGLYYVDRITLERIPKLSARWYADFISNKTQHDDRSKFAMHSLLATNVDTY